MIRRRHAGWALLTAGAVTALSCGVALAATPRAGSAPQTAAATTTTTTTTAATASPGPVPSVFAGDAQAFGVRLEVDEPLPAGPGDIPSVYGQVNSQENFATGTTAADLFGAVVGPKISDPTGDTQQYAQLPQATCLYPSQPNTDSQSYPTDGSDQQTVESNVTCSEGPAVSGTAYAGQAGGGAGVTNPVIFGKLGEPQSVIGVSGVASGHESLGPDATSGSALMSADAELQDFNIPGVVHVDSVEATGYTEASGRPGGATTSAAVTVSGLTIAGSTISIGPAGVQLGSGKPVPTAADGAVISEFNQAAGSVGCNLSVLSNPKDYPQGTLFARPPLPNRVNSDGTDAGSTAAGALLRCAIPAALNPTNFAPLIIQMVFGFVGTEADAAATVASGNGSVGPTGGTVTSGTTPPPAGSLGVPTVDTGTDTGGATAPALSTQNNVSSSTGQGPSSPPTTATTSATLPAQVADVSQPGALLPLRGTLEIAGLILALLICFAGIGMVAPWRVTMAPVDHPESGGLA